MHLKILKLLTLLALSFVRERATQKIHAIYKVLVFQVKPISSEKEKSCLSCLVNILFSILTRLNSSYAIDRALFISP